MTVLSPPDCPPRGFYVQFLAFDKSVRMFGSANLGAWATESSDRALERLRLFVHQALISMGEAAALSALRWAKDEQVARQVHDTLDAGQMYVRVIADGTTFYEISARPLVFPAGDEDRHGIWTAQENAVPGELTGAWTV